MTRDIPAIANERMIFELFENLYVSPEHRRRRLQGQTERCSRRRCIPIRRKSIEERSNGSVKRQH